MNLKSFHFAAGSSRQACITLMATSKVFLPAYLTAGGIMEQVVMMDGDNMPLQNPEHHFNMEAYKQHGNMFWPNSWSATLGPFGPSRPWMQPTVWKLLGLSPPWKSDPGGFYDTESGQVIFDRYVQACARSSTGFLCMLNI